MRREVLTRYNIELYKDMIPGDLEGILFTKNVHAFGAVFAETEAGILVWRDRPGDSFGELLNIYVLPEARRLGVGSFLLETAVSDMKTAGKEGISFKYADSGDRSLLTPFFNELGYETESDEVPVGRITFLEAVKVIKEKFGNLKEYGTPVNLLSAKERTQMARWMEKSGCVDASRYLSGDSESFAIVENEEVRSALLFSKEDEETISLDYAYSSDPKSLTGLLLTALKTLAKEFSKDTVIEMLLVADGGLGLYEKLFGKAEFSYKTAICRQNFLHY